MGLFSFFTKRREAEIQRRIKLALMAREAMERTRIIERKTEGERLLEAYREKQAARPVDMRLAEIGEFIVSNINMMLDRHPGITRDMILAETFKQLSDGGIAA